MSFEGKLRDPYYENIKEGKKIYEVRVYDDKRKEMKVGDFWTFSHDNKKGMEKIKTIIVEIKIYKTFKEAIEDTDLSKLLPGVEDVNSAIKTYEEFPHDIGTYKEGAEKYGVVRFKLELVY